MTKIRVHELAKKLGIENKELIDQLERAGVTIKSHASVLEEADLRKFESAKQSATAAAEVKVDEQRIGSGLIRRRASRAPEAPAPEPAPPAAPAVAASEPVVTEADTKPPVVGAKPAAEAAPGDRAVKPAASGEETAAVPAVPTPEPQAARKEKTVFVAPQPDPSSPQR